MKSSISAKIPTELYEEVQDAIKAEKYTSNTECIIEGLYLLLRNNDQEDSETKALLQENEKEIQNLQKEVNCSKEEIQALQDEVKRSKEEVNRSKEEIQALQDEVKRSKEEVKRSKEEYTEHIKSLEDKLRTAPNPLDFAQLQAKNEEKEKQIEEKDRHIETVKAELNKAERDKEDLKTTYNNYFLQVQTLINQKAIEAPGAKKRWWKLW
jgi:chromosome segregation ATPase